MSLLSFQPLLSWIDDFESIGHYWTSETSIICITWFPGMGWNPNLERSEQLRQEQAVGWDQLRWTKCRGLGIGPFWNTCKSEGRIYKHWCVNPILLYCFSLRLKARGSWCFFGLACLLVCRLTGGVVLGGTGCQVDLLWGVTSPLPPCPNCNTQNIFPKIPLFHVN